jgi:hypothetical protein
MNTHKARRKESAQPVRPIARVADDYVILFPLPPVKPLTAVSVIIVAVVALSLLFLIETRMSTHLVSPQSLTKDTSGGSTEHITSASLQRQRSMRTDSGMFGNKEHE